jgi:hypothetical protein
MMMQLRRIPALAMLLSVGACTESGVVFPVPDPPPISGGTLLILRDGRTAVASDPDYHRVFIVDLEARIVAHQVPLEQGSEPGRLVEDGAGRVHLVTRHAGALLTLDPKAGAVIGTRPICGAPRGLDYDAALDAIHVACATGELVTVPAAGEGELRRLQLDLDLRDVVVRGDRVVVSRFRSAELLEVGADGNIASRSKPSSFVPRDLPAMDFEPSVAWRTRALPSGGTLTVHQRALVDQVPNPLPPAQSYYGNALNSTPDPAIVHSTVTVSRALPMGSRAPSEGAPTLPLAGLPVDVAVTADEAVVAVASATAGAVFEASFNGYALPHTSSTVTWHQEITVPGQPIAVAYDPSNRLVVQTRRPATLLIVGTEPISLGQEPERYGAGDAAHDLLHMPAGASGAMACASCHPEGGDDGRVWSFAGIGERRTQTLRGGLASTAPFHWNGDLGDMAALMDEIFVGRMGGTHPGPGHAEALAAWLDALPAPAPLGAIDPQAVERGRALFEDAEVACSSCHSGRLLTNNDTVDVGTGGAFQVPSLVGVVHRAPFMHDGCAASLRDRFAESCGGGDRHGRTSHLTSAQVDDLVAYMQSL